MSKVSKALNRGTLFKQFLAEVVNQGERILDDLQGIDNAEEYFEQEFGMDFTAFYKIKEAVIPDPDEINETE